MMDFITVPVVVGMVMLAVYKLFELFVRKKERLILLEKMGSDYNPQLLQDKLFSPLKNNPSFTTLKIACLLLGVGFGLLAGFFINKNVGATLPGSDEWMMRETIGVIYGASVLFFGGIGLLVAFLLEQKFLKKD
jgi:hypothetical protein